MYNINQCDCTIDYTYDEMKGKFTEMEYLGKGVFICPNCKRSDNYSNEIYSIKVLFEKEEKYTIAKIIGGENRINKPLNDDKKYQIVKDILEEVMNDMPWDFENKWLNTHKLGIFEIDIYYELTSYYTDCGTEWDDEVQIVREIEIKNGNNA